MVGLWEEQGLEKSMHMLNEALFWSPFWSAKFDLNDISLWNEAFGVDQGSLIKAGLRAHAPIHAIFGVTIVTRCSFRFYSFLKLYA